MRCLSSLGREQSASESLNRQLSEAGDTAEKESLISLLVEENRDKIAQPHSQTQDQNHLLLYSSYYRQGKEWHAPYVLLYAESLDS